MERKAFYSLIQYCPDAARAEAINVGLVIFGRGVLEAKVVQANERIGVVFGRDDWDPTWLKYARNAFVRRLHAEREKLVDAASFERLAGTLGNDLILTPARPMRLSDDVTSHCERLFAELVAPPSEPRPREAVIPELDAVFRRLSPLSPRVQRDVEVTIPYTRKQLHAPYAFQNGRLNLVVPQTFSSRLGTAQNAAFALAAEGNMLYEESPKDSKKQLLVVPVFSGGEDQEEITTEIEAVFKRHNTRLVRRRDIPDLEREIQEAISHD